MLAHLGECAAVAGRVCKYHLSAYGAIVVVGRFVHAEEAILVANAFVLPVEAVLFCVGSLVVKKLADCQREFVLFERLRVLLLVGRVVGLGGSLRNHGHAAKGQALLLPAITRTTIQDRTMGHQARVRLAEGTLMSLRCSHITSGSLGQASRSPAWAALSTEP